MPAVPPVTRPVASTDAVPGALLLQVPPAVASDNKVVDPEHTVRVPNIAVGSGSTVTTAVVVHPVPIV